MKVSTPWRLPADLGVVRLGVGRGRPRSEEQDRGAESPAAQLCPLRAQTSRPSGGGHAPAFGNPAALGGLTTGLARAPVEIEIADQPLRRGEAADTWQRHPLQERQAFWQRD
jgi:hypothetical protein